MTDYSEDWQEHETRGPTTPMEHNDGSCRIPSPQFAHGGAAHQGRASAGPAGRAAGPHSPRGGAPVRAQLLSMRRSNVILADEVAELAPIRRVPSLAEL